MAFAHEAFLATAQHYRGARCIIAFGPRFEDVEVGGACCAIQQRTDLREVLPGDAKHLVRHAEGGAQPHHPDRAMKDRHGARQRIDIGGLELVPGKHFTGQRLLRKFSQLHCVFQHRTLAAYERRFQLSGDGNHIQIE